ncbi:HAAAP family serine/threonine permease [Martelella alba]|uniref:HAAAP family serine/threonine permease n=1 Tax=Martelella alba TaxID=2590451 RepID=A0ABY2ST50_9HYPH|nr:HAAAP family serine/threonine permease [Martelella alba]TKI07451.1 HAAAP family serine/threonine permease [Martelella alba]
MNTTQFSTLAVAGRETALAWRKSDSVWMLSLYGTAIGAGVLFLPINAGVGGFLPLLIMALLAFPMTFFAHRGLCRLVLSGGPECRDINDVVEQHFGSRAGNLITVLYFFAIYPILLIYSVAITNTVENIIIHQWHLTAPPRYLLSLSLLAGLMAIIRLGKNAIIKVMSILVFPFVAVLMFLAVYLIPYWNTEIFHQQLFAGRNDYSGLLNTLWLAVPVLVFSFNHSPIISAFAIAKKGEYGKDAERKCSRILLISNILMVLTVMFFVFSCVLSLSPEHLAEAKEQNVTILTFLANHFNTPLIALMAPLVALVAIAKSFFGHYLGACEGFSGLLDRAIRACGHQAAPTTLRRITGGFMFATAWLTATVDPGILDIIELMGGPIIALLLFLLPMYAIEKVPALAAYRGAPINYFVWAIGLISLGAILYKLW